MGSRFELVEPLQVGEQKAYETKDDARVHEEDEHPVRATVRGCHGQAGHPERD